MTQPHPTLLFAGGGTGGHLFPGLATAERLHQHDPSLATRFLCSDRALDARLLTDAGQPFTPLPMRPLPTRPWRVPPFLRDYRRSVAASHCVMDEADVRAVVAMGGFVAVPAIAAARKRRIPTLVVNLDAVPGKANRWLARRCDRVLTVHPTDRLPADRTKTIAMPLRRIALAPGDPAAARRAFGLDPDLPTLLVTGASQGAESINQAMMALTQRPAFIETMRHAQILHLAGAGRADAVQQAYRDVNLRAAVLAFCDKMGLAWDAADLAISRAGAGSVAEAAANAVPTLFMPYPHHRDQHQKHNAQPLARASGAIIIDDHAEPWPNAEQLIEPLVTLMNRPDDRQQMTDALRSLDRADGADQLAAIILQLTQHNPTSARASTSPSAVQT